MADRDRKKWNAKYQDTPTLLDIRPPSAMLERFYDKASGRQAIDLACGSGRNALFLAKKGFQVDAVDISAVGLQTLCARSEGLDVTCLEEDLDTFTPKKEKYDLLVMTNFLDRNLIIRTAKSMKSGALFLIETYMQHPQNEKPNSNPDFLLAPEELKSFFDESFTLLAYQEFQNEPYELYRMHKAAIVVQKR